MFDANIRYLPKNVKFIVFVESISKESELYRAGARKNHRYEALKTSEPVDDMPNNTMTVIVNGEKVKTCDDIALKHERLCFDCVLPNAAEMYTKEEHPINKKGL